MTSAFIVKCGGFVYSEFISGLEHLGTSLLFSEGQNIPGKSFTLFAVIMCSGL